MTAVVQQVDEVTVQYTTIHGLAKDKNELHSDTTAVHSDTTTEHTDATAVHTDATATQTDATATHTDATTTTCSVRLHEHFVYITIYLRRDRHDRRQFNSHMRNNEYCNT